MITTKHPQFVLLESTTQFIKKCDNIFTSIIQKLKIEKQTLEITQKEAKMHVYRYEEKLGKKLDKKLYLKYPEHIFVSVFCISVAIGVKKYV